MYLCQKYFKRLASFSLLFVAVPLISVPWSASTGLAQETVFRVKPRVPKGVYQPPKLNDASGPTESVAVSASAGSKSAESFEDQANVPTVVLAKYSPTPQEAPDAVEEVPAEAGSVLDPGPAPMLHQGHGEVIYDESYIGSPPEMVHGPHGYPQDSACDAMPMDYGCDSPGDWLLGPRIFGNSCDSPACGGCGQCSTGFIPVPNFHNGCWYSTVDWLNWERRGQDFPILAVNSTADPDVTLFGGAGTIGEDMDNGFRVSVGRWSDPNRLQAVQARFWALEEQSIGFNADSTSPFAIGIPYLNANDNNAPLVFPAISDPGSDREFLTIGYDSTVMGGDIVVRQLWNRGLGGRVDMIYGYQYFRLEESLNLSFANQEVGPPLSLGTVSDSFDVVNNFHGAKLGFNLRYDEAFWAFDGLFTLAFGGIERKADLAGSTSTQNLDAPDELPVLQNGGLFVRSTNAGRSSDTSFAVSPEINIGLGYRLNHHMHFRVGYTYLMVTDVLQVYRTIDRSVNLIDDNPARPARNFTFDDYTVHGLNLGLTFNY